MTRPAPRLALTFILITVALDAIGIGLIFPVMPDLIRAVTGDSLSQAALWGGVLAAAMMVICAGLMSQIPKHSSPPAF